MRLRHLLGEIKNMEALKEKPPVEESQSEIYGRSMRIMSSAGNVALKGAEVYANVEIDRLRGEFDSAVGEMLKTADGIGEFVTIERRQDFDSENGKILADNRETISEIVKRGFETSLIASDDDPRMVMQAERDLGDKILLEDFVEPMFNGEDHDMVMAVSSYPRDGVFQHGNRFVKELGYNDEFECAIIQMYSKQGNKLKTRTLSVDYSNLDILADMLRERGADVPEDVTCNTLIQHPVLANMGYEDACKFMDEFVADYELETGQEPKELTTMELLDSREGLINKSFDIMYMSVAESLAQKQKTESLKQFASEMSKVAGRMKAQESL
ncbi:MAG: hypothetical protein AAB914_03600, partial [Patescibacteria group bacterium]